MGVYIKGMEMPKNCGNCPLRASCIHRIYMEERPSDCPLVPVPPHGRLIDADALAEQTITEWLCGNPRVNVPWRAVSEAPTIIPAEEGE